MAKQMTEDYRRYIELRLQPDGAPSRSPRKTTILHEIVKRSVACRRGWGCSDRGCARFDECTRLKGCGGNPKRLFRCTAGCFESCPEFVERTCPKLDVASP